jgi:hypothetical protein
VAKEIDGMERESSDLRNDSIKICWYMRGGVSYNEVMAMNLKERQLISALIKENLETTKKSGLPFY